MKQTDASVHQVRTDLVCWLMCDGSRVAEPVNRDTLLAAILVSRVECASMRDWTSSVVGRASSCQPAGGTVSRGQVVIMKCSDLS